MKIIAVVMMFVFSISIAHACDRGAAMDVQLNLKGLAKIGERAGVITYTWKSFWHRQNDGERLGLIRAAANADACVTGQAREIRFYSPNDELVGIASPTSGIRLIH